MKADAIANESDKEGASPSENCPVLGETRSGAADLQAGVDEDGTEVALLKARIAQLEQESGQHQALRKQAEQALAITRRRFSKLLEESAPHLKAHFSERSSDRNADVARLMDTHHRLATTESALRQKEEEASQVWTDLSIARARLEELKDQLATSAELQTRLAEAEAWAFKLAGERHNFENERIKLERALEAEHRAREIAEDEAGALKGIVRTLQENLSASEASLELAEDRRDEAYDEIVSMTNFLRASERLALSQEELISWLTRVTSILNSKGPWWSRLLPRALARKYYLRRLAREQLFDAKSYLSRYPDVRASGQDPLKHYLAHGIAEGRRF